MTWRLEQPLSSPWSWARAPPKQAAATRWPVVLTVLRWHVVEVAAAADNNHLQEIAVHGIVVAAAAIAPSCDLDPHHPNVLGRRAGAVGTPLTVERVADVRTVVDRCQ